MINERAIQALYQRQGWEDSLMNDLPVLDEDNTKSRSGKYFNVDYHPLVTIKNIYNTQEDEDISDADFNKYLRNLQLKSIRNVFNYLFPSELFHSSTLSTNDDGNRDVYTLKDNHFVGVEIEIKKSRNSAILIDKVGLYMGSDDSFDLYLYHSSKNTHLKIFQVTANTREETFTRIRETLFAYSNDIIGGKYYLGYFTEDVNSLPIRRDERYKKHRFCNINFIQVPVTDRNLFDTEDVETTSKEFLNIDMSFYRDYTEFIIKNESLFDDVIGKQVALESLRIMYSTTRSNYEDRELDDMKKQRMFFDMHGNSSNENYPYSKGIIQDIEEEKKRLKKLFKQQEKLEVNTLR